MHMRDCLSYHVASCKMTGINNVFVVAGLLQDRCIRGYTVIINSIKRVIIVQVTSAGKLLGKEKVLGIWGFLNR